MKKTSIIYPIILLLTMLIASCSTDDVLTNVNINNTSQVSQVASTGSWRITYFNDSGRDETKHFEGYQFVFNVDGSLLATNNTKSITGRWSISNNDSDDDDSKDDNHKDINFNISFTSPRKFDDLSDDWDIVFASDTQIKLKDGSEKNGGVDFLTFERW